MAMDWSDLVALSRWRAEHQPSRRAFAYVAQAVTAEGGQLTYEALDRAARGVAALLAERAPQGAPVLVACPSGLEFVAAFWGCLYARAPAVVVPVPDAWGGERALRRLESVVQDAAPACALTTSSAAARLRDLFASVSALAGLELLSVDEVDPARSDQWRMPDIRPDHIAMLQYTSGSTGVAKGVVVNHANILANCRFVGEMSAYTSESSLLVWAPMSHVAGLMYGVCTPVCQGIPAVHMATQAFIEQPVRWLQAISHFRATHAGGPNFCYDLCVRKVRPEHCLDLALDSWINAYSSGETVRPDTLRRFADAFAFAGFRPEAFQPCYGISESTLRVAQSPAGRSPTTIHIDAGQLGAGRAVPADSTSAARTIELVGYGPLHQSHRKIRIVDPADSSVRADGTVGEIWIAGPDIAAGYWNRPDATAQTFGGRIADDPDDYLRTGDLGVCVGEELYLVGRLKELIIIRGVNHFPQDIEQDVEGLAATAGVEGAAAFSADIDGEERLVLVAEVLPGATSDTDRTCAAIQEVVSKRHNLQVHDIVLVPRGALPRTVSGKLQRGVCRSQYQSDRLDVIARWTRSYAEAGNGRPPPRRETELGARIRAALSERVGLPAAALDGDRPFAEVGLDSAGAVSLLADLGEWLGRALSPSVLFDHPTIDSLVAHLVGGASAPPRSAGAVPARGAGRVPIAIVGMACRFPGEPGLEGYWRLLRGGIDAVREVPRSRWDVDAYYNPDAGTVGKTNSRAGGFIEDVDLFDRELFGLAERAATDTDPQQRLLLEVAWEAMEDAAIAASSLAGSRTGVFVGISQSDYGRLTLARLHDSSPFVSTGASPALAANRLSYTLDLRGPSISVDTACSSSLVALHQACRAMQDGDCDLALVGGVSLLLTPDRTIALSQGTFLSSDGRCKPFDAAADGYVRGEGVGVIVLKPLDRAQRDGDRIHAVVRGTAVNQDGRTNGLTAPNGLAQQAVIRAALDDAGLSPRDIGYIEAHGTGTALGDPIEVEALGAVLTADRASQARPCAIGAVKSNIGHLEAAAGIAGLIKAALCLEHRTLVPTLHFHRPNPHIPFASLPVAVQTRAEPWPADGPRVAGVSSFGYGGTNAHAILAEAPTGAGDEADGDRPRQLLVVSGASEPALRALVARHASLLASPSAPRLSDLCATAAIGRSHLSHRLAVQGESAADVRAALESFLAGEETAGLVAGRVAPGHRAKVAFLFTGQGAQYTGMGRELYRTEPVFRGALDRCAAILEGELDRPLLSAMFGDGVDGALLDETAYTQPALFALGWALAELWRSWGVEPDVVLGHSIGELTAACVAGVFDLEEGLRLVAARGRLMQALPAGGAMFSIAASEERVARAVAAYPDEVSIAALNGPASVVLAGVGARVRELVAAVEAEGIRCRRLHVSHAFHSPLMEPMLDAFESAASTVAFRRPRVGLIANVTGQFAVGDEVGSAAYWRRHVREPVRFAQGAEALVASECGAVLELGPQPTLIALARAIADDAPGAWAGSLDKGRSDWESILAAVAAVHVHGGAIDWNAFARGAGGRKVAIPTYAFQRRRYWIPADQPRVEGRSTGHPLLGKRLGGAIERFELDLGHLPAWVDDHRVHGHAVLPGAAYVEIALAAAREHWGPGAYRIRDVSLLRALVLDGERDGRCLHVAVTPEASGSLLVRIFSGRSGSPTEPVEHARGEVERLADPPRERIEVDRLRARFRDSIPVGPHYDALRAADLELHAPFRGLRRAWRGDGEALAEIEIDPASEPEGDHLVHPALLDAALQVSGVAKPLTGGLALPIAFERVSYVGPPGRRAWAHAVIGESAGPTVRTDIRVFDGDGSLRVHIEGYVKRMVSRAELLAGADDHEGWLWREEWTPSPAAAPAAPAPPRRWLILADDDLGRLLAQALRDAGHRASVAVPGSSFAGRDGDRYDIDPTSAEQFRLLLDAASQGGPLTDVVHGWALAAPAPAEAAPEAAPEAAIETVVDELRPGCGAALHLAQALVERADGGATPRLWLLTRGAQPVSPGGAALAQAPLWGFGRVLQREHPELSCALVDLDPDAPVPDQVEVLLPELAAIRPVESEAPVQIALHGRTRLAPRLARLRPARRDAPFALAVGTRGDLASLRIEPRPRRAPSEGEVEVRVHAASINFRDVLNALGMYPGTPPLGSDVAGTVVAVGPGNTDLAVGDEVFGVAEGSLASHVTCPAARLARKPAGLDFAQAAGLPVALLTCAYALSELARMQPGESILIHTATGGTGLAAVRLAQRAGLRVFATAGSERKRAYLRSLGVAAVESSRNIQFADAFRRATGGRGVDIVLNMLSGDFVGASLSLVREGGRFLELGRRDVWTAEQMAAARPDVHYHPVYLGDAWEANPALLHRLWSRLAGELDQGSLEALPAVVLGLSRASEAFAHVRHARHIGKVVLVQDIALDGDAERQPVRADATYVVTGGLSGLGLLTARWLVEQGARALVLVGRRGPTAESDETLRWIEGQGARLLVRQADVSRAADVRRVLAEARASLPPLRGVFHCAGTLADRSLGRQTWESFEEVLAPKVAGAWNLHTETRSDRLDLFVLFSSLSAIAGSPGQSNYAAANAYLDALAHHRRAGGRPALSIDWCAWSGVGMATRAGAAAGRRAIAPADGLRVLGGLVASPFAGPQVVVRSAERGSTAEQPAADVRGAPPGRRAVSPPGGVRELFARTPIAARDGALRGMVRQCVAGLAGKPADEVPADVPFVDLGLDSLMLVELRNKLSAALGGHRLPNTLLLKFPTVEAVCDHLGREVLASEMAAPPVEEPGRPPRPDHPVAEVAAPIERGIAPATDTESHIVVFPGDESKVPLVLLHGVGGYGWVYLPLREFVRDRKLILVNKAEPRRTLREYVALLVDGLRAHQPHGPYILGGWSTGGRLAFEVAAALERLGEPVLGLLMFDVYRQTSSRRLQLACSRLLMNAAVGRKLLAGALPIESLYTVFGSSTTDIASVEDIIRLARLVLPEADAASAITGLALEEAAAWFLDQLAVAGGRGLMLPDATGGAGALATLRGIRDVIRMTMEVNAQERISAPGFLVHITGNRHSRGWERHFDRPIRSLDVSVSSKQNGHGASRLSAFSSFADHLALFDPENVPLFGPKVAEFLAAVDGGRAARRR